ncbi:hypothetical protein NC652_023992, partial [Populus alba x Populus x berolinensis]
SLTSGKVSLKDWQVTCSWAKVQLKEPKQPTCTETKRRRGSFRAHGVLFFLLLGEVEGEGIMGSRLFTKFLHLSSPRPGPLSLV